ncbi:fibrobacter succinogenes major paralogous domain-containing protein [Fibrobacter sp. UWB11]|uniref:fibrobacter succinogenes major paralogous domain-containing protein n=1 Tax=Fibrobacter sp. UWB11 TaxID=1896202 RepID=UPI000926A1F7|nr:fibrobacter succinogenes major paralogous domain-containing protein [Fibrobacter sp. UWB11]SIN85260.1 major paralogous domain-containing protein [Fibrobacter sp. UWB11]
MTLKKFLMAGFVVAVLVACGDDGSSNSVTDSDEDSSSSVCVDCDGSSSSLVGRTSCNVNIDENCMKDSRDGQTYKTVKIGTQIWMAENLNYAYTDVPYNITINGRYYTSDSISWCFDDDASNCAKYGRLYTWAAVMDSVGAWTMNGKGCGDDKTCSPTYPVRGICPEGWHLPTKVEFEALFIAVGGTQEAEKEWLWNDVGKMLKSTSGWYNSRNGTDAYAFSALPAGSRSHRGLFDDFGYYASFWSSTEFDSECVYLMDLYYYDDFANLHAINKDYAYSVRCVKDE